MSAEDSPSWLLRLRLTSSSSWIALFKVFAFFLFGRFLFCLFVFRHTASCGVQACSALIEMAQIKPSSSRPTAVMIFL